MKTRNKVMMAVFGMILFLTSSSIALAADAYWSIGSAMVPRAGAWGITHDAINTKQTDGTTASFNGDTLPNWYGYDVCLANTDYESRSDKVKLYLDDTSRASNVSLPKGYYAHGKVYSKSYEPSDSKVWLHFSADSK